MTEKETSKQNNMEKFEIREQNKNKTEAKWKYKVRCFPWQGDLAVTHTYKSKETVVLASGKMVAAPQSLQTRESENEDLSQIDVHV